MLLMVVLTPSSTTSRSSSSSSRPHIPNPNCFPHCTICSLPEPTHWRQSSSRSAFTGTTLFASAAAAAAFKFCWFGTKAGKDTPKETSMVSFGICLRLQNQVTALLLLLLVMLVMLLHHLIFKWWGFKSGWNLVEGTAKCWQVSICYCCCYCCSC
jgi:hypothetical protein